MVATLGEDTSPETLASVLRLADAVAAAGSPAITDLVPSFGTLTAFYDRPRVGENAAEAYAAVCRLLEACAGRGAVGPPRASRSVEVPVCYGGACGPDLEALSTLLGRTPAEVVGLHSSIEYLVHAVGFTPGFPYLGGLPEALRAPRRSTPRVQVPAGSVGIGGSQTGIYPVASPGGWHLIGRTPLRLFSPAGQPAALLRPGDRVWFTPMTQEQFESWR